MSAAPFQMTFKMKNLFFDRKAVMDATERAERRNLSKAGSFVRNTARKSIKPRKKVSRPGSPPSRHRKGKGGIRTIFFVYEPRRSSVVVGAVSFGGSDAPELLEHGGTTTRKLRSRSSRGGRKRTRATYRARPFMEPALIEETPKFEAIWKDSIK